MTPSSIKTFLCAVILLITPSCIADSLASSAVTGFYAYTFSPVQVQLRPAVGNLLRFCATFGNPFLSQQTGFVDSQGNYLVLGTELVTDPAVIGVLKANATTTPGFTVANLQGYNALTCAGSQQLIGIDMDNRYALVGGSLNCIVCDCAAGMTLQEQQTSSSQGSSSKLHNNDQNCSFAFNNAINSSSLAAFYVNQRCTLGTFIQGNPQAPKTIYVFGEPNCPECNKLYVDSKPFVDAGELSIHWALTFFIQPNSFARAAAILQGNVPGAPCSTPAQAWEFNENNFDVKAEMGGIPPATCISFNAAAALNRNQQFFLVYTSGGTPFIFYKNVNGVPKYTNGTPSGFAKFLMQVGPLADCTCTC